MLKAVAVFGQFVALLLRQSLVIINLLAIGRNAFTLHSGLHSLAFLCLSPLFGLPFFAFSVQFGSVWLAVKAFVGLFKERYLVVKAHEVERSVEVEVAIVGNGVAQRRAVFELCTANPTIGGVIGEVGINPIEDGQQVERRLIGEGERLVIV